MSAVLFGSISTLADTSELQRQAYNDAFAQHGLDWTWDQEEYAALLDSSGGQDRVASYADARGETVDAAAVHATKSELFQQALATAGVEPRPGVVDTIRDAHAEGFKVALVTTTSEANVRALVAALSSSVPASDFDLLVDSSQVSAPKPDQAAYAFALAQLGESAASCVAIEDNVGGVAAASAAGVPVFAFPNENTAAHGFDQATSRVDALDFAVLRSSLQDA